MRKFSKTDRQSKRVAKTRQRLLQAAVLIFSEKGYRGSTTRGIAEAAGLSELTLFRHFGSKKNLFMSVVQHGSALPGLKADLEDTLSGDLRRDLNQIGYHFLQTIIKRRKAILMTLSEAVRQPEVRQATQTIPDQQLQMLAGYLDEQVQAGNLRPQNPSMLAQAFLGMLFAYALNMAIQEQASPTDGQLAKTVSFFVDIFLDGSTQR